MIELRDMLRALTVDNLDLDLDFELASKRLSIFEMRLQQAGVDTDFRGLSMRVN